MSSTKDTPSSLMRRCYDVSLRIERELGPMELHTTTQALLTDLTRYIQSERQLAIDEVRAACEECECLEPEDSYARLTERLNQLITTPAARCGRDMGDGFVCVLYAGHECGCCGQRRPTFTD